MTGPIASLAARLALSVEAKLARSLVLDRNMAAVGRLWPRAIVSPVGSFVNDTSLVGRFYSYPAIFPVEIFMRFFDMEFDSSDVDVVVNIPGTAYTQQNAAKWAIMLQNELVQQQTCMKRHSSVYPSARVPIVTYLDDKFGVGVDVSFLTNSIANTEYVKKELGLRPYMRTMIILLKYW